ncbi:SNARE-interacting protein KEULE [Camellia lanceoleosa]|uniref:SNARE-interacting protein KEULE n=1 Tax=Camellia lanceoleosa TaxID=1840588 RepID=A0ACC0HAM1_9ERIC|nr:SNARE-interacting protein KEULE [Camellia lanceoleosa]
MEKKKKTIRPIITPPPHAVRCLCVLIWEMNKERPPEPLDFFIWTVEGFITDNVMALEDLFGDEESTRKGDACLNMMATCIATAFASLREFPLVRYCAANSLDPTTMTTFRDLIPTKLAAGVWNCLMKYKADLPNFPQTETCELLIVDRSVDQIAPVIHEWTYDAMCHDLLNMDGNKYVHELHKFTMVQDAEPIAEGPEIEETDMSSQIHLNASDVKVGYFRTLKEAEHAAAKVALMSLLLDGFQEASL